jgi:hypothetical protein
MERASGLTQPQTFEYGGTYLLLDAKEGAKKPSLTPVKFAAYDPCPAFVIVHTEVGKKQRCLRERVFLGKSAR